jgi:hypothetical protein
VLEPSLKRARLAAMLVQPSKRCWCERPIWVPVRSTSLARERSSIVPVPARFDSLTLKPPVVAPPLRESLTLGWSVHVSRVRTSRSTTPFS